MVAAIDTFLINPDVRLAEEVVDLAQEIVLLVAVANPPGILFRSFQRGGFSAAGDGSNRYF